MEGQFYGSNEPIKASTSQSSTTSTTLSERSLVESNLGYRVNKQFTFNDANFFLVAEDTTFGVHRGILGRHSTVFNDLCKEDAWQGENRRIIDGKQALLLPHTAYEVKVLLGALYDGPTMYV